MKKNNKAFGCLYDIFGLILFLIFVFGTMFMCSSNVREGVTNLFSPENDKTAITVDSAKMVTPVKVDSVITLKKDTTLSAQKEDNIHCDTVPLTKSKKDNLFYLNVGFNGVPMKFALDTGCSGISMSIIEYLFLERQELISTTKKRATATLADGNEVECFLINIDSLKIGTHTLKNVECMISTNQDASLLLGQDVLSQIGDVTIKYNKQILLIE